MLSIIITEFKNLFRTVINGNTNDGETLETEVISAFPSTHSTLRRMLTNSLAELIIHLYFVS